MIRAYPKPGGRRLKGAALQRQNQAIIERDGDRCGICRRLPPPSEGHHNPNHFTPHHNIYPERPDIEDEKISACPECGLQIHSHRVWMNGGYVQLKSKAEAQEWIRRQIELIKLGEI